MEKTFPALNSIEILRDKPTLICDADEVIFDFMNELLIFLKKNKLSFNWASYALTGNIIKKDKKPLDEKEVKELLSLFFKSHTKNMRLINGVKESLTRISKKFNIVILSNIPFKYYELRKAALNLHSLNFPFYANKGEKGTACSIICQLNKKETWFIDDSPLQVSSVRRKNKNIKTILFIENYKLAKLINNKKDCDFYSTNWKNNEKILLNRTNNE